MLTLTAMLQQRTHRDLELIARTHGIPFSRRQPKAHGLAALRESLEGGALVKAFAALDSNAIGALQALVAAGGYIPLISFKHHFGEIRPYKPWRVPHRAYLFTETVRHPWRAPLSVAERLYHLGMIQIHDWEMVEIVADVAAWLPAIPQAQPEYPPMPRPVLDGRLALLRDVAALLGGVMQVECRPVHGRWLPLSVLQGIHETLRVKDRAMMEDRARSELQTGRIQGDGSRTSTICPPAIVLSASSTCGISGSRCSRRLLRAINTINPTDSLSSGF